jgi:hypothetical protein
VPWGIGCDLRLDLGHYGRNSNYPDLFRGSLIIKWLIKNKW